MKGLSGKRVVCSGDTSSRSSAHVAECILCRHYRESLTPPRPRHHFDTDVWHHCTFRGVQSSQDTISCISKEVWPGNFWPKLFVYKVSASGVNMDDGHNCTLTSFSIFSSFTSSSSHRNKYKCFLAYGVCHYMTNVAVIEFTPLRQLRRVKGSSRSDGMQHHPLLYSPYFRD